MNEHTIARQQLINLLKAHILTDKQTKLITQHLSDETTSDEQCLRELGLTKEQKMQMHVSSDAYSELSDDDLDMAAGGKILFCKKRYTHAICWGWNCSDYKDEFHHMERFGNQYHIYYERSCLRNYFDSVIYLKEERTYS